MKLRSLIVATFVFFALAGALYWSGHRKPADEIAKASADTAPAILKLDEASITRFEVKARNAEPVVLEKSNSGSWQIVEPKPFRADQSAVSGALSSLSSLASERVVGDRASDLKQFGLDHPAVEIDITEKDNESHQLLIGDDTPAGSAVYAMLAGDPRVFTMASYNKTSIDKSLNDLRDKRLLTVSADKVSRLDLIEKNQEIEFGRNKDEWQILKPRPLRANSVQVGELVGKLTDARMDLSRSDKETDETASAFTHATPVATAKVTDPSGTQELQVRKSKDTYYAKSSMVDGIYKVDSSLGQALDKKLDDFRDKNLFDFGYNDPTKIEIHSGSEAYFLTKGGADWWSNGKKMDAGSVEALISDLRDLSASKFVDSGFADPTIELTISSDDGKRVERVSIAKSGDGFVAKRENEPTLYYLDSSPVDALQKAASDIKPAVHASK
ncbi:MAG: DUF4340 domain-containing protein [Candidatus Sulfotelmatobacter sp.]